MLLTTVLNLLCHTVWPEHTPWSEMYELPIGPKIIDDHTEGTQRGEISKGFFLIQ